MGPPHGLHTDSTRSLYDFLKVLIGQSEKAKCRSCSKQGGLSCKAVSPQSPHYGLSRNSAFRPPRLELCINLTISECIAPSLAAEVPLKLKLKANWGIETCGERTGREIYVRNCSG
jgi:hypothetical protein